MSLQRAVDQLGGDAEVRRPGRARHRGAPHPARRATSGSSSSTSRNPRPDSTAPRAACSTSAWAAERPSEGDSAAATLSLITSPPVRSMSPRILSASTSRPGQQLASDRRGRAGQTEQVQQRLPFGLPPAGAALVLLEPSPRASSRPGPGHAGRRRSARSRPPGCACAAWSRSRRDPRHPPRSPRPPRSGRAARRRARSCRARRASAPSAAAIRAGRSRTVCQGTSGAVSWRRSARRAATSRPRSPRLASVPTAPPNCTASSRSRTARSSASAPSRPDSQPAALSPKVTGIACWSSVRPGTIASRWRRASAAHASAAAARSADHPSSARRQTSIIAVSIDVLAGGAVVQMSRGGVRQLPAQRTQERRHGRALLPGGPPQLVEIEDETARARAPGRARQPPPAGPGRGRPAPEAARPRPRPSLPRGRRRRPPPPSRHGRTGRRTGAPRPCGLASPAERPGPGRRVGHLQRVGATIPARRARPRSSRAEGRRACRPRSGPPNDRSARASRAPWP